ncbi:hypothetical protein [Aneurinibacillus terranovensis]|uniref:hypothetical protein n=1 Tax=Aneurinibacillus terranovensis TaxID=278991 RepID=UPI000404F3E9|nr:hypothetical protein [Aneurinibacillus terranovensis]
MASTKLNEAKGVTTFPNEVWVGSWVNLINKDSEINRLGNFFTADIMFKFGKEKQYILNVYQGKVQGVIVDPIWDKSWDFGIVASQETWQNSIEKMPKPFYQDLFGMMWNHGMTIEGNAVKAMQNIRVLKLMMALMKHA